jgi:hypothetical protein
MGANFRKFKTVQECTEGFTKIMEKSGIDTWGLGICSH